MTDHPTANTADRRSVQTLLWATPLYWLRIFPAVTRELRGWHGMAERIPDPELRRLALVKLDEERSSAEGAAAFAILATRDHRLGVARACVAFEVLYDYLDALGEAHPTLDNNRNLHAALADAVDRARPYRSYYASHPRRDDGGYLRDLVSACRAQLAPLPSTTVITAPLLAITKRAREAQSRNHAGPNRGRLREWASHEAARFADVRWFEFASGAGSPLGIFALFAAASHATTSDAEAHSIADAYFPWVAALHWLLESVVDHADDLRTGNPSYVAHYGTRQAAAARIAEIAARSAGALTTLPQPHRHLLLLSGMVALNLVHEDARHDLGRDVTPAVREAIGPMVAPFLLMLRARGAAKRLRRLRPAAAG